LVHEHRDRIYIRKDIILKLAEHGELNQSRLMSYCGLNNVKHREIVDELVDKGLIVRTEEPWGNKKIIKYRVSERGRILAREILEPYEELFPRDDKERARQEAESIAKKEDN
jgi:predicted transcriptional regulator